MDVTKANAPHNATERTNFSPFMFPVFLIPTSFMTLTAELDNIKETPRTLDNLTDAQANAIRDYTVSSKDINEALLAGPPYPESVHKRLATLFSACRDAYQKELPNLVIRVMQMTNDQISKYVLGLEFFWPNFVSTSRSRINWPGNIVFIIRLNPGKRTFAIDVTNYSAFRDEREVLLCAFSRFKVIGIMKGASVPVVILDFLDFTKSNTVTYNDTHDEKMARQQHKDNRNCLIS